METKNKAAALDAYLAQQEHVPFDWARMNCCHFAQGWVALAEGRALDLVPKRVNRTGVLRAIEEHAGMRKGISQAWGRAEIAPAMAHAGDVVLFEGESARMLGLCVGRTAACKGEDGVIVHVPMTLAVCAWPVGREA